MEQYRTLVVWRWIDASAGHRRKPWVAVRRRWLHVHEWATCRQRRSPHHLVQENVRLRWRKRYPPPFSIALSAVTVWLLKLIVVFCETITLSQFVSYVVIYSGAQILFLKYNLSFRCSFFHAYWYMFSYKNTALMHIKYISYFKIYFLRYSHSQ